MTPGLLDSPLYWEKWKYTSTSALMEKEFYLINKQATKIKLQIISINLLKSETFCAMNLTAQYCHQNTSLLLPSVVFLLFTIVLECPN